ncbi:MAG: DUF4019 domain-containing protein [Rhizomicrobium sp.]
MRAVLVAFALLLALPALAQAASGSSTAMTPSPDQRAKQWLILVDDGNYATAYRQMGKAGRDRISEPGFAEKLGRVRAPLGAMASRGLKDVKLQKTLPGMADGQYATIRFDTIFARKAHALETVRLVLGDKAWSVIGYFIR